jgi:hypothetical protein
VTEEEDTAASPGARSAAGGPTVAGGYGSVTVQHNQGIISTGDNAANTLVRLPESALRPPAEVDCPSGLSNLPARPGLFVGREDELRRLDDALAGPGGAVVQAVHGLGGIGKSTLAAHWAATRTGYSPVWWITADSPAAIDAGIVGLAAALEPVLAAALPDEVLRERALQWLAAHDGWLVILDNVTNPADIAALLARAPEGRFLITSRRATGWHDAASNVPLEVFSEDEAVRLLTSIAPGGATATDDAATLCRALGYLPLAVGQAGAYIAQAAITPGAYLGLLGHYPASTYATASEGGEAQRTIARIWDITLDRLNDEPLAGQVLRILAWYAPQGISRDLLNGLSEPPQLIHALSRLAAYSMIKLDTQAIEMHRLVQAVTRTPDPASPHRDPGDIDQARQQATALLEAATPGDWQDPAQWPACRAVLPHIDALATHTEPGTDTAASAVILERSGLFLVD